MFNVTSTCLGRPSPGLEKLSETPVCRTWVRESFSRFEEDGAEIEALKVARTFDLTSRPGWTRFLVTLIFANNYFMAGLSKLCASGVAWTAAENLKAKLLQTTLTQTSWGVWKPTTGSGRPKQP